MADYKLVNGEIRPVVDNVLYHHGVKGMKWGIRKAKEKGKTSSSKRQKKSYEDTVRSDMETYNKQHPERSKKDNYTIALRAEKRRQEEAMMKRHFGAIAATPIFGLGLPAAIGNMWLSQQKLNTIDSIMDEYNIENAKRVVNM